MQPPDWLLWISVTSLAVAAISTATILYDLVAHKRQMMAIMKWVWPITGLYLGPVAVWAYHTRGLAGGGSWQRQAEQQHQHAEQHYPAAVLQRPRGQHDRQDQQEQGDEQPTQQPFWQLVFKGVTHCGAGCTLGDILAE